VSPVRLAYISHPINCRLLPRSKSLVSSRDAKEELQLRVLRGTNVMEQHEIAMMDLCMLDGDDKDMQSCLDSIHNHEISSDIKEPSESFDCDDEENCLLDSMYAMWDDELKESTSSTTESEKQSKEAEETEIKKDPAPWSSRSSPSGTYELNPNTGKLENVDNW
jgi:hypothetical protein